MSLHHVKASILSECSHLTMVKSQDYIYRTVSSRELAYQIKNVKMGFTERI